MMPKYNFKVRIYFIVGYRKLENIIKEYYEQEFNFIQDQGKNIHRKEKLEIKIDGKVSAWNMRRIREFKKSGEYEELLIYLMNDLAKNKIIRQGYYFIQIAGKDVERE